MNGTREGRMDTWDLMLEAAGIEINWIIKEKA